MCQATPEKTEADFIFSDSRTRFNSHLRYSSRKGIAGLRISRGWPENNAQGAEKSNFRST